jgi:hypothetical protein
MDFCGQNQHTQIHPLTYTDNNLQNLLRLDSIDKYSISLFHDPVLLHHKSEASIFNVITHNGNFLHNVATVLQFQGCKLVD